MGEEGISVPVADETGAGLDARHRPVPDFTGIEFRCHDGAGGNRSDCRFVEVKRSESRQRAQVFA